MVRDAHPTKIDRIVCHADPATGARMARHAHASR